ncbi:MAG TPA: class I SAM-dependent methyltransferase [Gaiellaceae bacterium]|nr:class I SAM-dependent methyltransferase [Gaiellaceae bacterium]
MKVTFDVAADAYDRFMGRYSVQLSAQLADLAGVTGGQRVLDVGCGPGALTGELVARLCPDAVSAVDPSESFVAAARERHPGVHVEQAAAERLPFDDDEFDAAVAQLVVHFMSDPVAGLRESARVTRRGGVVAACVWDYGGGRGPASTFWRAVRTRDDDADEESGLAGARAGHLAELFTAAGLAEVVEATLESSIDFASFDEWWEPYTLGVGPPGAYVARLDTNARTELQASCRRLLPPAPFTLTTHAWAVRGVVASGQERTHSRLSG